MRLEHLKPSHVRDAVSIYLAHAWPRSSERRPPIELADLEASTTLRELRELFGRPGKSRGVEHRRYTLRLGNSRYPFMKLVVQEYLLDGEYFFSVDTHDDMRVDPSMPDYAEWLALREHNQRLKVEIEAAWAEAGLPTHSDLRALCENVARDERGGAAPGSRGRLLLVDDEAAVAEGLAAVLRARGYAVETAFDGEQVLARMSRAPLPDLVVLDFAMPGLDGEEVMRRLRADPRTRDVPVLLATASKIDLGTVQRATGLLQKPYPHEVFVGLVDRMMDAER